MRRSPRPAPPGPTPSTSVPPIFADFAQLCGTHFKFHHEVSVPTALRFLEVEGRAPTPQFLDCWGCSQAWAKDPAVINQHACGHRLDLGQRHVRDAFRHRLDRRPFARDDVLESQIYELDAEQGGAWDGKSLYWETARNLDGGRTAAAGCRPRTRRPAAASGATRRGRGRAGALPRGLRPVDGRRVIPRPARVLLLQPTQN